MKVLVSKEDSWKLDTSMFCLEGSWETGYVYDEDIFFMVGVTSYYEEGAQSSSFIGLLPWEGLMDNQVSNSRFAAAYTFARIALQNGDPWDEISGLIKMALSSL